MDKREVVEKIRDARKRMIDANQEIRDLMCLISRFNSPARTDDIVEYKFGKGTRKAQIVGYGPASHNDGYKLSARTILKSGNLGEPFVLDQYNKITVIKEANKP